MGHFKILGGYFSPSVIQRGPGFPFFHPHVYEYLFSGIWSQTNIDLDCIPDNGLRIFSEDVSLKNLFCLHVHIIESTDSISTDEQGFPLTQYITNGGISRARYTITHIKHNHRVLWLISNRMKSTKVQILGGIWQKYWNISIENNFSCICIR